MKLLITIVQNDDVTALLEAIVESGHSATKLSSSGGLLRNGNTTLLIGVEDKDVDEMMEIIRSSARSRSPTASACPRGCSPTGYGPAMRSPSAEPPSSWWTSSSSSICETEIPNVGGKL